MRLMLTTPTYRPEVHKDSSCGSVVLAALLEMSTQEADMWMDLYAKKGWNGYTNVSHIRTVCEKRGIKMNLIKPHKPDFIPPSHHPMAVFVQMKGPWERKGWRSAYSYTHWALCIQGMILDINSVLERGRHDPRPEWTNEETWRFTVLAHLADSIKDCNGFKVRAVYEFVGAT